MTKNIEPKPKLISEYLKISGDEMFVIPEYQRSYSWTVAECDKLWQDIITYMESGEVGESGKKEPYFFGTIIADCSKQDDGENLIRLIDGQQRTTTFILLLKALLLRLQDVLANISHDEEVEGLKDGLKDRRNKIVDLLCKTDSDHRHEFIKDWSKAKSISIIESKSINEIPEYKKELQIILEAKDYVEAEARCYKIPRKREDNKYTNFFRNFKYFSKCLAELPESRVNAFAKTFLGECQIIEIRSWNTDQAIAMFNSLNSTGMPLADADIISAELYAKAGDEKQAFMSKWENINSLANALNARKIVGIDSLLQQFMYIRRAEEKVYIRDGNKPDVTTPGLRRYFTIERRDLLKNPMLFCVALERLSQTWDRVKEYSIVKLLLKFNENAKIYLISYLNRYDPDAMSEKDVSPIAECLLRLFAVLELVDVGYSSAKFKTFLFGENIKLVDKTVSIDEIVGDFTKHIKESWEAQKIIELAKEYDKNILVYLNEYLYAKSLNKDFEMSDSVNVEHIMPASGHNKEIIRQDAGIGTKDEFDVIVNKLGNKILLEEDINKSISNDWFKTKKQKSVKEKAGYKDSRYFIAHDLISYPSDVWTKNDIASATEKAAARIVSFVFGG